MNDLRFTKPADFAYFLHEGYEKRFFKWDEHHWTVKTTFHGIPVYKPEEADLSPTELYILIQEDLPNILTVDYAHLFAGDRGIEIFKTGIKPQEDETLFIIKNLEDYTHETTSSRFIARLFTTKQESF